MRENKLAFSIYSPPIVELIVTLKDGLAPGDGHPIERKDHQYIHFKIFNFTSKFMYLSIIFGQILNTLKECRVIIIYS